MSAIVFIGPTISADEVRSVVGVDCWPPAAQGDVYRAVQHRPRFIGIIDGYFDGVASVWHKEILWALSEGVTVLGASSMGALRAAELCAFGMTGVGEIFEGFRSGKIEDDDEVAVLHGPAELGYVPLSEPMVNIRPTLEQANLSGVLTAEQTRALVALAKSMDYPERTWELILERAKTDGLPARVHEALAEWLPSNRVDQKKLDAYQLLQAIKCGLQSSGAPTPCNFSFEQTILWQQGTASWSEGRADAGRDRDVLDELMLTDQQFAVRQRALLRKCAAEWAFERDLEFGAEERRQIVRQFREQAGLTSAAAFRKWMDESELTDEEFKVLLIEELSIARLAESDLEMFDAHTLSVLRLEGSYKELADRALRKAEVLASLSEDPSTDVSGTRVHPAVLEDWFFKERPKFGGFGSVQNFVTAYDLQSKDDFYTILECEYLYLQQVEMD